MQSCKHQRSILNANRSILKIRKTRKPAFRQLLDNIFIIKIQRHKNNIVYHTIREIATNTPKRLKMTIQPKSHDVLIGGSGNHHGNIQLRAMIDFHVSKNKSTPKKRQEEIACAVEKDIARLSGRFLTLKGGKYEESCPKRRSKEIHRALSQRLRLSGNSSSGSERSLGSISSKMKCR